jgi:ParB/RepB/Spo0J family partition protein
MAPKTATRPRRRSATSASATRRPRRSAARNTNAASNAASNGDAGVQVPPKAEVPLTPTGTLEWVATDLIEVPKERHKRRSRARQDETTRSIAKIGIQTPLKLAKTEDGRYELVAGEGRLIGARAVGLEKVPAYVEAKDTKRDAAITAAENMVREDFSPAEEADAIKSLLDQGYRQSEVPVITGMSAKRVTARLALVEMSEEVRSAYGHGGLPASTAQTMKEWFDGSPAIAETIAKIAAKDVGVIAKELADRPGYVLTNLGRFMQLARLRGKAPFVASLRRGDRHGRTLEWDPKDRDAIKLKGKDGKWFRELAEKANYWDRPKLRFTDEDLDAAAAIGVAFSERGEHGQVWIHDRGWLTDYVNDTVLPRLRAEAEKAEQTKAQTTKAAKGAGGDLTKIHPSDLARKLSAKFTRELKPRAHSANLDLATALLNHISTVTLTKDVAVFFAYQVLGRPNSTDQYGWQNRSSRAYAECLARVMPNLIGVEEKKLKTPGKVKRTVVYLDGAEAEKRMWEFIDGAKSAEEVIGRTLIVFAAASRFVRECGPNGKTPQQQTPDHPKAVKALERIIAKVVPASVKRIEREKVAYDADAEAKEMIAEAKGKKAGRRSAPQPATGKPALAVVPDPEDSAPETVEETDEQPPQAEELPLAA